MRYFIKLDYLGTNYHGWQIQPNGITVQEELNKALSSFFKSETSVVGCGRTDAGVHARNYIAHFDSPKLDASAFLKQINLRIPPDIAVTDLYLVEEEAHARYDAHFRRYEYEISYEKEVFFHQNRYQYPYKLKPELSILKNLSDVFLGEHDFYAFHKLGSDVKHTRCLMTEFQWEVHENGIKLSIGANRFLRGMVRLLVGASINIGLNKVSYDQVYLAVTKQKPLPINLSVPAEGLSLVEIKYPYELRSLH